MKKHFHFFLLFVITTVNAQQSARYGQSADEFGLDNPAGLSFEEMRYKGTVLSGYLRNQWWKGSGTGFPSTQVLSLLNTRHRRHQYGGAFLADKIGETRNLGLMARYAHTVAKGLKIGVSAAGYSQRIAIENLDEYDAGDELVMAAGEARWRLSAGVGAFYHMFNRNRVWNWFAGASIRHAFLLDQIPGSTESPAETDILAQGGIGRGSWWAGGRLRVSIHQPGALDVYLRKYLTEEERFFLSVIVTSDKRYQTAGMQAGLEWPLSTGGINGNHYLITNIGISKPVSKYIEGNNLIFDVRVAWAWQRRR